MRFSELGLWWKSGRWSTGEKASCDPIKLLKLHFKALVNSQSAIAVSRVVFFFFKWDMQPSVGGGHFFCRTLT